MDLAMTRGNKIRLRGFVGGIALTLLFAAMAWGQPVINVPALPDGEATAPYAGATFTASDSDGTATCCTWLANGNLNGLALSSDGVLSGTPASAGAITFTVTATDTNSASSTTGQLTINVAAGPSISPASLPAGQQGVPYNQGLTGTNGSGSYTLSLASAPPPAPGLSFTGGGSGSIGGTPTQAGTFNFSVQITDSAGGSAIQGYSILINPPPPPPLTLGPSSLPQGDANVQYNQTLTASGGTPPYSWS